MDYIGSSVQDVVIRDDAPVSAGLLVRLRDIDSNRIASSDSVVIHKAVLALLTVVSELESRINALEAARDTDGELQDAAAEDNASTLH